MSSGVISVFIGRLPEMKMTEPYSPERAREGESESREHRGQHRGDDHSAKHVPAAGTERLRGILQVSLDFEQRGLHGAHCKGHPDERHRQDDTEAGVGDVNADQIEVVAEPTVGREHCRERNSGDGGRQRERHVDHGVHELSPRKLVTRERPGDDEAEDQIDAGREQRAAEREP